uniref:NADH dehydrogenase subunit 6 n=1 Tax=Stenischia humilis TaxID=3035538 RepID=UPI00241137C8|nr:NADH dehydrogenase subunit 6 [Stenischia humilis]WEQ92400.1 NADH dehydrogenase subunit 6 [Stenischia humilis]
MLFFSFGMLFSLLFSYMTHPLTLGFMLMIQTLWISLIIGQISKTFWFSYILFITFLGGLLILFIYMTSISTYEFFNFSFKYLMLMMLLFMLTLFLIFNKNFFFMNFLNNMDSMINNSLMINLNTLNVNKLYNAPNNFITIFLILYLLITLLIVVKITDLFYGPMRKNF